MNLLGKPDRMVQTAVAASHWQESSCLAEASKCYLQKDNRGRTGGQTLYGQGAVGTAGPAAVRLLHLWGRV